MDMFSIEGGHRLRGTVRVDGSKNAALPILAATLAIDGVVQLERIPQLQDISTMVRLLQLMGSRVTINRMNQMNVDGRDVRTTVAPYEMVRQMRASVCVLGPLLARFGTARVSLPGGCNIGHRPIDLHLRGLAALGTDIRLDAGYVICRARSLRAADVDLLGTNGPTVTGTCNVMVAATKARGTTVIRNAAREPEVQDLAKFLKSAGAMIHGEGTETIEIEGVDELQPTRFGIISDRIETATLAIATAITHGDVIIENAPVEHLAAVIETLRRIGVTVESPDDSTLRVTAVDAFRPVELTAAPYPGLPTDTQAQFMALLTLADGQSRMTDAVFPERFMHASELIRMGAQICLTGNSAQVTGVSKLSGAPVMASDLRASAALVLAGLAAEGRTEVRRVYHLDRGYRTFEQKLNQLGANIERLDDTRSETKPPAPHFEPDRTSFRSPPSADDLDSRR